MRLIGRHDDHFALFQKMRLPGNMDFHFAVENVHESIIGSGVLAQPLALGKSKTGYRADVFADDFSADDGIFLIVYGIL